MAALERWRCEGISPKFLRLCGRILYRQVNCRYRTRKSPN
jgi:hypothetical protein